MIDANTVLNQLAQANNGANRLITMIGAKNFTVSGKNASVSFKFMHGAKNKANHITITLNTMDTYDVEFIKIHGFNRTIISKTTGLYGDMLFNHFVNETGLALKF